MRIACVHMPEFSAQAAAREWGQPYGVDVPLAVVSPGERSCVVEACPLAIEEGVRVGMTRVSAQAVCADIHVIEQCVERDLRVLTGVADALFAFGPTVSLVGGDTVLVDSTAVQGVDLSEESLTLMLEHLGLRAQVAIGSNAFAALSLATHGDDVLPFQRRSVAGEKRCVAQLPLSAARLPKKAYVALQRVGVRTIGAFMALPSASLARRFGEPVRRIWRQAHRRTQMALPPYVPVCGMQESGQYHDAPLDTLEPVCFALKVLTDRLSRRLKGRGLGADEIQLEMLCEAFEPAVSERGSVRGIRRWSVEPGTPAQDASLLLQVLRSRLVREPPSGPVIRIGLSVPRTTSLQPRQLALFGAPASAETVDVTVARLAAVIGSDACFSPCLREDYRPERAWRLTTLQDAQRGPEFKSPPSPRPTRLLHEPTRLNTPRGWSPNTPISGPERLVTGWWDGRPIARDYWTVADRWGRRSWIFRELDTNRWFVHGYFD